MHRLFSSLTGEGEEMPKSHIQPLVFSPQKPLIQTTLFETNDGLIEWHRFFAQLAFEQDAFNVVITILSTLAEVESFPEIQEILQGNLNYRLANHHSTLFLDLTHDSIRRHGHINICSYPLLLTPALKDVLGNNSR
jgi:hypothetical protein